MPLSDDLTSLDAWLSIVADGSVQLTRQGIDELRCLVVGFAERAAELERGAASPSRDHEAIRDGLASGKVALIAAHRVRRLPDLPQPGWTA